MRATGRLEVEQPRRWSWLSATGPFSPLNEPGKPAHFIFEQISDKTFRVPDGLGFQYNPRATRR